MYKTLIYIVIILLLSCGGKKATEPIDFDVQDQIEQSNVGDLIGSYSSQRHRDIIRHLYEEALENDESLSDLDERLANMPERKHDALRPFSDYHKYNEEYYATASNYVDRLSDGAKRDKMMELLNLSRKDFTNSIDNHKLAIDQMHVLESELADQAIMMKLVVVAGLMEQFQNAAPKLDDIKGLSDEYVTLINATNAVIEN